MMRLPTFLNAIYCHASPEAPDTQPRTPAAPRATAQAGRSANAGNGARSNLGLKLRQLLKPSTIGGTPPLQFGSEWRPAPAAICQSWLNGQYAKAHCDSVDARIAQARMVLRNDERSRFKQGNLAADALLFSECANKERYYDEQIMDFLRTVQPDDPKRILDTFQHGGMGGLHRHPSSTLWFIKSGVGAAKQLTPDLTAKAVLSAIELLLQIGVSHQVLESGGRRFRNAQAEEVMVLGKADATPRTKQAPPINEAAHAFIRDLRDARKTVVRVQQASAALHSARAAYAAATGGAAEEGARQRCDRAKENLELLFAKQCYQSEVKAAYKAASESVKKEWLGNQRLWWSNIAVTGISVGATLLGILTPVVLSAAVTGGIGVAVVLTVLGIYLAYHFSRGEKKDAEQKGRRAILAIAKSIELMTEGNRVCYASRAESHRKYRQALSAIKTRPATLVDAGRRAEAKALALKIHLEELAAITLGSKQGERLADATADGIRADYTAFTEKLVALGGVDASAQIKRDFADTLTGKLETKMLSGTWKTPLDMRFSAAQAILLGLTAQHAQQLRQLNDGGGKPDQVERERTENAFKSALLDMANLELCLRRMRLAQQNGLTVVPASAHGALAAVANPDVRALFIGNAQQQVHSTTLAKTLKGELPRYGLPNLGAALIPIVFNGAAGAADLGVNGAKLAGTYVGSEISGYHKILQFAQVGPSASGSYNAATRDAFAVNFPDATGVREAAPAPLSQKPVGLALNDDARLAFALDQADVAPQLDGLVLALTSAPQLPTSIELLSGGADAAPVSADLSRTQAYAQVHNRALSWRRSVAAETSEAASQAKLALTGPFLHLAAYLRSRRTAPLSRMRASQAAPHAQLWDSVDAMPASVPPATAAVMPEPGGAAPEFDDFLYEWLDAYTRLQAADWRPAE